MSRTCLNKGATRTTGNLIKFFACMYVCTRMSSLRRRETSTIEYFPRAFLISRIHRKWMYCKLVKFSRTSFSLRLRVPWVRKRDFYPLVCMNVSHLKREKRRILGNSEFGTSLSCGEIVRIHTRYFKKGAQQITCLPTNFCNDTKISLLFFVCIRKKKLLKIWIPTYLREVFKFIIIIIIIIKGGANDQDVDVPKKKIIIIKGRD